MSNSSWEDERTLANDTAPSQPFSFGLADPEASELQKESNLVYISPFPSKPVPVSNKSYTLVPPEPNPPIQAVPVASDAVSEGSSSETVKIEEEEEEEFPEDLTDPDYEEKTVKSKKRRALAKAPKPRKKHARRQQSPAPEVQTTPRKLKRSASPRSARRTSRSMAKHEPPPSLQKGLEGRPAMACLFCRGRKIACGLPLSASDKHTCK
jgi:hypothetical protein